MSDNECQKRVGSRKARRSGLEQTEPDMRRMVVGGVVAILVASGCQQQSKPTTEPSTASSIRPSALDVTGPANQTPMYKPTAARASATVTPPAEPAITQTPVLDAAPAKAQPVAATEKPTVSPAIKTKRTPASAKANAAKPIALASGNSYRVQKGDTLFAIAKAQYGDGKQWQKIVAANPGVS